MMSGDLRHEGLGAAALEQISGDTQARVLIRGGAILSMDPEVGDFAPGDLLIEGRKIVAVGSDLREAAADGQAIVIDATDHVLVPGFIDTHRHCWQTQFRRLLPEGDLPEYMEKLHLKLAPEYSLEDLYLGNHLAALGALDSGVTCVLDFSHNMRSYDHADAVIRSWEDAGARGVVASSTAVFGERDSEYRETLTRIQNDRLGGAGLVSLRMGVCTAVLPAIEGDLLLTADAIAFARELGIAITVDAVFGTNASAHIAELHEAGVLGPDITWIHCTSLDDRAWDAIQESEGKVSLAVTSDELLGCEEAIPPIQIAIDRGLVYGLSVDVECCLATDMFSQMQAALNTQRMMAANRRFGGDESAPPRMAVREMLEVATAGGAKANGVWDKCGSLTPGKEADVLVIDLAAINSMPLNNAVGSVVLGIDSRNIEAVLVGGRPRKWDGALVDVDVPSLHKRICESRDRLLEQAGIEMDVLG